jgi:cytochrome c556
MSEYFYLGINRTTMFAFLPHEEGLVKFLRGDEQFNEQQVRNGAKKLHTSAD